VHPCVSRHRSKSASVLIRRLTLPSSGRAFGTPLKSNVRRRSSLFRRSVRFSVPFIFATRLSAVRLAASYAGPQSPLRRKRGITSKASWFVLCNRGSTVQHLSRPARAARPASLAVSARSSAVERFNLPACVYRGRAPSCTMNRMNTWAQGCGFSVAVGSGLAKNGCGTATRPTPNPSFKRTRLRRSA